MFKAGAQYGILLVAVALIFEGASLLFWKQYGIDRIAYHLRVNTNSAQFASVANKWPSATEAPDSFLGWVPNREHPWFTADGRRKSPSLPTTKKILAYGDSFVFGADVTEKESFPHQLSLMIDDTVENFGVGGYGPDQAIIRLERHLQSGKQSNLVILGMPSENIARVVNVIRRLYIPLEGVHFAKPIFVKEGGQWRLVNDVPKWPPTTESLQKLLDTARKYDLWHTQNEARPSAEFPYSLASIQAFKFLGFDVLRWQDLYKNERAVSTLRYILRRFVGLSKRYNFTPVFVIVPMPEDLLRLRSHEDVFYSEFLELVRREFKNDLLVVNVLGQAFDLERFHVRPFSGHASAYGNHVIATAIHERIRPAIDD